MSVRKETTIDEFKEELLKRPEIKREYEALKPKYTLISRIIERRNQLNMSQTKLAKAIGSKQPAISRLEKGDYNVTLGTLLKVADVLGLKLSFEDKKTAYLVRDKDTAQKYIPTNKKKR